MGWTSFQILSFLIYHCFSQSCNHLINNIQCSFQSYAMLLLITYNVAVKHIQCCCQSYAILLSIIYTMLLSIIYKVVVIHIQCCYQSYAMLLAIIYNLLVNHIQCCCQSYTQYCCQSYTMLLSVLPYCSSCLSYPRQGMSENSCWYFMQGWGRTICCLSNGWTTTTLTTTKTSWGWAVPS